MPLNKTLIDSIAAKIADFTAGGNIPLPMLRAAFPGITFVRLRAEDMDNVPYQRGKGYDLHLIDCSSACIKLTDSPECADGVVVATP
jgi:hypothetical protein